MKKSKKTKVILIVAVILVGVLLLSSGIFQPKAKTIDGVDYINQIDAGLPTGCESVCAVMALNYIGVDVTTDEFVDKYLKKSDSTYEFNPYEEFGGDPRTADDGMGCFYTAIEAAINRLAEDKNLNLNVVPLKDMNVDKLCHKYIDKDIPVVFWATVEMREVYQNLTVLYEGQIHAWSSPSHCLLLVGYDEDNYIFHDTLAQAYTSYPKSEVKRAYNSTLSQALVVTKK